MQGIKLQVIEKKEHLIKKIETNESNEDETMSIGEKTKLLDSWINTSKRLNNIKFQ